MSDDQRSQLQEIRLFLKQNQEVLKPVFGLTFWELERIADQVSPEEIAAQGINLTLTDPDDEVVASFVSTYIQLWTNSRDFNAASRFIASSLQMSADELLQTRQLYLERSERP